MIGAHRRIRFAKAGALALAAQPHAPLELLQRLVQGLLARFQLLDDRFQLGEGTFEVHGFLPADGHPQGTLSESPGRRSLAQGPRPVKPVRLTPGRA